MDPLFGTKELSVAQYIATVLTLIRRDYVTCIEDFRAIIDNGTVVGELEANWDYYHMYDFGDTVEELTKFEPLIRT
jgi:hypothetical protein